MTFRLRSRNLVAATGILAVVGVGGGVAYAYPSTTAMEVSASASSPDAAGNTNITVTVLHVNPTCKTRIIIDGTEYGPLDRGVTTFSTTVQATPGRHRVRARNVDCLSNKKDKESAKADFVISNGAITQETTPIRATKNAKFSLTGLSPIGAQVTVVATLPGGADVVDTDADKVSKRGTATVKLKFPEAGTYVLTATINTGVVATKTVTVS